MTAQSAQPEPDPDSQVSSSRIFEVAETLIGVEGVAALTLDRVAELTSLSRAHLEQRFPNAEALVFSSAVRLADEPVIRHPPQISAAPLSVRVTAERLAAAHRRYVAERPTRFAALHELGGVALFGFPSLQQPLRERNRRTREALLAHLRATRDIDREEDLRDLATTVVGIFNGIELCFLDDDDADARDAAYRETVVAITARLTTRG